ncbi:MAG: prealbumin-like fold domain-containing protein, partial [Erysipelotrichaceae bacterium]|nr:prealbumin-like fold domain-containing protein [Erysipelotrichaceae bacterium]
GLEEGKTYTLHEEAAPNGYYVANDVEFTVSGDKVNEYHTIVDEKILTDIEVVKIDSSTKEVITGLDFAFTLYADEACTEEITTVNANTENGTVTFEDLEYGTYYIRETQAPKGYQLSDEVIKVVVDDDLENVGDVYSLNYNNAPTPTVVVKTGDTSNIALYAAGLLASAAVIEIVRHKGKGKKKSEDNDGE